MDIKWLEDFLVLAQTRNFSQASIERNITQPAFSRRIRSLESWLGALLFDRRTYPVALTAEGRAFRDTAETIVSSLYAERAYFQEQQVGQLSDLRIAAPTTLNLNFVPDWLQQLGPGTGHLTSHLLETSFHDRAQKLADGEVDFVFQYCHPKIPIMFELSQFQVRVLAIEPMVLVSATGPDGHPLHDPLQLQKNGQVMPYLGYSNVSYFAEVEKLFFADERKIGLTVRRLGESPVAETLKRLAISYGAAVLLPETCARDAIKRGELAEVGDPAWQMPLEVRLYRSRASRRPAVLKIWAMLDDDCAAKSKDPQSVLETQLCSPALNRTGVAGDRFV